METPKQLFRESLLSNPHLFIYHCKKASYEQSALLIPWAFSDENLTLKMSETAVNFLQDVLNFSIPKNLFLEANESFIILEKWKRKVERYRSEITPKELFLLAYKNSPHEFAHFLINSENNSRVLALLNWAFSKEVKILSLEMAEIAVEFFKKALGLKIEDRFFHDANNAYDIVNEWNTLKRHFNLI